ncbi:MAG TPA: hypothetical protein GX519_02175 [Thermoanaerobacterales bacterium]|nr:hypothetical protein [Thermoanaerobacterales bacterium]
MMVTIREVTDALVEKSGDARLRAESVTEGIMEHGATREVIKATAHSHREWHKYRKMYLAICDLIIPEHLKDYSDGSGLLRTLIQSEINRKKEVPQNREAWMATAWQRYEILQDIDDREKDLQLYDDILDFIRKLEKKAEHKEQ